MEVDRWRVSLRPLLQSAGTDKVAFRWAGSMAITGAILAKNPYMSFSQKVRRCAVPMLAFAHSLFPLHQLVQARVVAQASTLVTLLAFGVLAGTHQAQSDNSQPQQVEDHSWKRILGTSLSTHSTNID